MTFTRLPCPKHGGSNRFVGFLIAVIYSLCLPLGIIADDWPRLGGIDGRGVSAETGLLRHWPEVGPAVLWTVPVGEGFAGPAVRDGQVYLLDREDSERDIIRCFELLTGKELWKLAYSAPGALPFNGSRNVPTVDDESIYALGPLGHLNCFSRLSHQVVWSVHLVEDFKVPGIDIATAPTNRQDKLLRSQVPTWGVTQAPLLWNDLVIVAPQTQETGLVAFDRKTGHIRWKSAYIGRNWFSHISPMLAVFNGVEQIIMLAQPSDPEKSPAEAPPATISAVDPQTGKILWQWKTPGPDKIPIPQPIGIPPDKLFITSGYGLGCFMLQVAKTNEQWQPHLLFHTNTVAAHIHSPVCYKERIYTISFKGYGGTQTGLACIDMDGNPLGQTGPDIQFDNGSFLIADGLALVLHGKTGWLHLFDIQTESPRLLEKAKVLDARNGNVWAPMALSQGKLLVRDQHELKCLRIKPE